MLLIYGRKRARIKKYADHQNSCSNCKAFDLSVKVYMGYFQLYYIPIFPTGEKEVVIHCNNCGEPVRTEAIQEHYSNLTRRPFYLYAGIWLFLALVLLVVYENLETQKEKARFIASPMVGDVYQVRKDQDSVQGYYFLQVSRILADTVFVYLNTLEYNSFNSRLRDDDYFVKAMELGFDKKNLKKMLEKGEIISVERNYGTDKGFNRIR